MKEKKRLLIIRSAPLNQIKRHLNTISKFFATYNIDLLTQTSTRNYVNQNFNFKKVFYTNKERLSIFYLRFYLLKSIILRRYDVILIPFTNINGEGYANVIWLSLLLDLIAAPNKYLAWLMRQEHRTKNRLRLV